MIQELEMAIGDSETDVPLSLSLSSSPFGRRLRADSAYTGERSVSRRSAESQGTGERSRIAYGSFIIVGPI